MNINLPQPWDSRYRKARFVLVLVYLLAAGYFAFIILFPAQYFTFDFHNALATKNTILEPRTTDGTPINNGRVSDDSSLVFDTALEGNYSHVRLDLDLEQDASAIHQAIISARKSYRAFFYPQGSAAAFPTGTLLKNNDRYFIINETGSRVRFASPERVRQLGYDTDAFLDVSDQELALNPEATPSNNESLLEYQNGTLFQIGTTYYQLLGGKLYPFVSENAYLTRYTPNQAIVKTEAFLRDIPVSEEWLGFKSGTRVAFADGVFLVNNREIAPIGSAPIFEALGFQWSDNIPASEEEIGIYTRGKIVLDGTLHPDGTVFLDQDTGKYFLIQDKQKHEITSPKLLSILLGHNHPILASSKALQTQSTCTLEKALFFNTFSCDIPLEALSPLPGNAFEFRVNTPAETDISSLAATFETAVTQTNLRTSLSQIKQRILSHYGYGQ